MTFIKKKVLINFKEYDHQRIFNSNNKSDNQIAVNNKLNSIVKSKRVKAVAVAIVSK